MCWLCRTVPAAHTCTLEAWRTDMLHRCHTPNDASVSCAAPSAWHVLGWLAKDTHGSAYLCHILPAHCFMNTCQSQRTTLLAWLTVAAQLLQEHCRSKHMYSSIQAHIVKGITVSIPHKPEQLGQAHQLLAHAAVRASRPSPIPAPVQHTLDDQQSQPIMCAQALAETKELRFSFGLPAALIQVTTRCRLPSFTCHHATATCRDSPCVRV